MVEIKTQYRICPLALLLMYMIGSSVLLQFHHHSDAFQKAYERASACEKVIHFSHVDQKDCCQHEAHLSPSFAKCSICDHHVFPSFFTTAPDFSFIEQKVPVQYGDIAPNFYTTTLLIVFNKGPPFNQHLS